VHRPALPALVLLTLLPTAAPRARAEFTAEDRIRALYSPMLGFTPEQVPIVRVGLATGLEEVRLETRGPARVFAADQGGLEWHLDRPARMRVTRTEGRPAQVAWRVVVERLRPGDFEALRARSQAWLATGHAVRPSEQGRVFGQVGRMFDNRRVDLLLEPDFPDRAAAERAAADLAKAVPGSYGIEAVLATMPGGEMQITVEGVPGTWRTSSVFRVEAQDDAGIVVRSVEYGRGFAWHKHEDVRVDGEVYVTFDREGALAVANTIDAETLLMGVVAGEIFPSAPAEALKAQAVTARNEVLSKIGLRHQADPFHICADVDCQVYKGKDLRTPATDAAVKATRGEMLFAQGALVQAYYHSDSGGFTEANEHAWLGQDPDPSLRCAPDLPSPPAGFAAGVPADRVQEWLRSPPRTWTSEVPQAKGTFRWTARVAGRDIEAGLPAALGSPAGARLEEIRVGRGGGAGRASELSRTVGGRQWPLRGELTIRRVLGAGKALRSSLFVAHAEGDHWVFEGGGFGHGVGMCQMGAIGRAKAGQDHRAILGAYYRGARVEKVY